MKSNRRNPIPTIALIAGFVLCLGLIGCGDEEEVEEEEIPESPRTTLSDAEHFLVHWDGPDSPLPFQELFELQLEIVNQDSGEPADGLELDIRVRVDDSTAEMPTELKITDEGDGMYRLDGFLFHVPRAWNMVITIDDDTIIDHARFEFDAVGRYTGELPDDPTGIFEEEDLRHILTMSPAGPPPPDPTNAVADDEGAAHLGQFLFFDERFSETGNISCAGCHSADHGFSDPDALSLGLETTPRRSMPSLNSAYHRWFFWDGRTDSLWSQALGPIESRVEHGINRNRVAHIIDADPELKAAFEAVFSPLPDLNDLTRFPINARPVPEDPSHEENQAWLAMSEADQMIVDEIFANFGKALAAYQRRLVRNEAPFDEFVAALREGGDGVDAISEEAIRGLALFVGKAQCVDCHNGHQLTNFEFHNLGLEPRSWMPAEPDPGRSAGLATVGMSDFSANGPHSDAPDGEAARLLSYIREPDFHSDGQFKTPGLRNVAERAPYMHGGHHGSLSENVEFYGDLQEDPVIGIRDPLLQQVNLNTEEVNALVAFLESLSGALLPHELMVAPATPAP